MIEREAVGVNIKRKRSVMREQKVGEDGDHNMACADHLLEWRHQSPHGKSMCVNMMIGNPFHEFLQNATAHQG